jgi:two-component system NtrC family sensor kinase
VSERHGRLFEQAADGIFTVDETGHLTSVNLIMERAMGHRRGDLIGTHCCLLLDPSQRESAKRLLDGALAGKRLRAEIPFRDVAGRDRIGSITCTPIVEHGRVHGALCIVRDVTQERRFAEELRQREKLAAVGQLVSGVAHELNNPLAGISAFAQLLEGAGPLTAEQRDAVDTIQMEAKRAAKIVSSLLLFSRQRQPERSSVDLNRVLTDALALRRFVLSTEQIETVTDFEADLPQTWADPFQLQQVVLNLLINAEHALTGRKGKRKITLRTQRSGDRIVATVSDNGPGISEEMGRRVFEPFFTTKPVGEGSGLGLAISHGIVRQHGGQLRFRSTAGTGATFEIDLPILLGLHDASHSGTSIDASEIPRQRRFLIVDNEPAMRQALQMHLRRTGCFADAVGDANAALALLATRTYGSIFLDLHLSGLAGESLFAELVERDPDHAGRVIFATGDLESPPVRRFLQDAGRPFVGKPFALSTVAAMLTQAATR